MLALEIVIMHVIPSGDSCGCNPNRPSVLPNFVPNQAIRYGNLVSWGNVFGKGKTPSIASKINGSPSTHWLQSHDTMVVGMQLNPSFAFRYRGQEPFLLLLRITGRNMQQIKMFKGVDTELGDLEKSINEWLAQSNAKIVSMSGNIAPQAGKHGASNSFSTADVLVIIVAEVS
jgi:hypothetical protein